MTDTLLIVERLTITGMVTATEYRHPKASVDCVDCATSLAIPQACEAHPAKLVVVKRVRNLIVNSGLNFIRDTLEDASFDAGIRYMSWGTGSTAPAAGNTQINAEDGRKTVTSWTDGTTGKKTTTVYLAPADANITIEEFGWHASTTATATADSGILWAHSLYPGGGHLKDELESIQVDREDTFA